MDISHLNKGSELKNCKMKKAILFPVMGILAITLWSFTPAPQATSIITGEDGIAYIPSTCNISQDDMNTIIQTLRAQGPDYGFLIYMGPDGTKQQFGNIYGNPVDPEALRWVDAQHPGLNVEAQLAFTSVVFLYTRQVMNFNDQVIYKYEKDDAIYRNIGPILQKYGYVDIAP